MTAQTDPFVLVVIHDGVAELTLNRPKVMNALAHGMLEALRHALEAAIADPNVCGILITGAGKGFCAGADLTDNNLMGSGSEITDFIKNQFNPILLMIKDCPKPTICALNGAAAGAGAGIALACDIVIAARSARFVLSFVKIAAVLDGGTSHIVARLAGPSRAKAMALLGDAVSAKDAKDFGLVWSVVNDDELINTSRQIAQRVASGFSDAQSLIKRQLSDAAHMGYAEALDMEAEIQGKAFTSADLQKAVAVFTSKN